MAHATAWAASATGAHPHSSGGCTSKTKVLTSVDPPEASVPGLVEADISLCPHRVCPVCVCVSSSPLPLRTPVRLDEAPPTGLVLTHCLL